MVTFAVVQRGGARARHDEQKKRRTMNIRFQIEISKNQNSVKSTCTDLVIFENSQGLYTYFSHCFDFWKVQFENEIFALFFSGREQGKAN